MIVVNDGSSDGSEKIVQQMNQKDDRIKLINQENKGVSEARNKANAFICMYRHFSCVNGTGNQKSYYRYLFIGK